MIEVEPAEASVVFGDRIELARRFTAALGEHGEERRVFQRITECGVGQYNMACQRVERRAVR